MARRPFVDGTVTWNLRLAQLSPGAHTLFIAVNDVNGVGNASDRVNVLQVSFTVEGSLAAISDDDICPNG